MPRVLRTLAALAAALAVARAALAQTAPGAPQTEPTDGGPQEERAPSDEGAPRAEEPIESDAEAPRRERVIEAVLERDVEAERAQLEALRGGCGGPERAINVRAGLEVGAYHDDVGVGVLTPSVTGHVDNPLSGWALDARYLVDVVSAASPDIVSTASRRWSETRHAGNVGGRYQPGNVGVALNATTSYTPDYLALGASAQVNEDLLAKTLTLVQGYGFGHDVIGRAGTSFSAFSRELDYHTVTLGASRVVNPSLVVGVFGDLVVERGDQSKPYRYVPIFSAANAERIGRGEAAETVARLRSQPRPLEQLPLGRERGALTARLALRLPIAASLRLEERLYLDSWGLEASTTDARVIFDVGSRVMLWPHVRFHVQGGVDFWQRAYVGSAGDLPAWRTGDRELGPLASTAVGGGVRLALGSEGRRDDWLLTVTVDGTNTQFFDAVYVSSRLAGLAVTRLEVAF